MRHAYAQPPARRIQSDESRARTPPPALTLSQPGPTCWTLAAVATTTTGDRARQGSGGVLFGRRAHAHLISLRAGSWQAMNLSDAVARRAGCSVASQQPKGLRRRSVGAVLLSARVCGISCRIGIDFWHPLEDARSRSASESDKSRRCRQSKGAL
jgi:hypothetical protein